MPNIKIIGFDSNEAYGLRERIEGLLQKHNEAKKAVTTIINVVDVQCCEKQTSSPYIQVGVTNKARGKRVAKLINKALNLDVELLFLDGFFPKKP